MSNYTKRTEFAEKDGLPSGDPRKIIFGTEIDDEFNYIATAITSKADYYNASLDGVPTAPTASSGTSSNQLATTAFVTSAISDIPEIAEPTRQIFYTSDTYTPPANVKWVKVICTGGGGGGGGFNNAGTVPSSGGGAGGGAGGTAFCFISAEDLGTTETVTVGAGGAGGGYSGGEGQSGEVSSFGTHCSAVGGNGGRTAKYDASGNIIDNGMSDGSAGTGATTTNGWIIYGGAGAMGTWAELTPAGAGGSSYWGGGGRTGVEPVANRVKAGTSANCRGAGGGGGYGYQTDKDCNGGSGGAGIVIVEEFY